MALRGNWLPGSSYGGGVDISVPSHHLLLPPRGKSAVTFSLVKGNNTSVKFFITKSRHLSNC